MQNVSIRINSFHVLGDWPMSKYRTPEETEFAIIWALRTAEAPMSRSDIAKSIGRRKTPHLIDIIEGLVERGVIVTSEGEMPNGMPIFYYSLAGYSEE
jgi:predicted transcriptional regulator